MGFILKFLLVLLVPSSLTQEDEGRTCTTLDRSALTVDNPSHNCSLLLEDLALACGDFISCAMYYSMPMCFCEACSENYSAVIDSYNALTNYTLSQNNTREKECKDLLFKDSGVGAVNRSYQLVVSLWNNANCKVCQDNNTEFYGFVDTVLECWADPEHVDDLLIETFSGSQNDMLLFDGDISSSVNYTICNNCAEAYHQLTSYYEKEYNDHQTCADIGFHMKMMQMQWNKYGCDVTSKRKRNLRTIVSIAAGFVILIVVFYGGVNLYGYFEEKREKKIYSVNSSSNDQLLQSVDTTDHAQHPAREENAYVVPRTNIN